MSLNADQLQHFGLESDPFQPYRGPVAETAALQVARAEVRRLALGPRPLVGAIVGPTGVGKTECVSRALRELPAGRVQVCDAVRPGRSRFNEGLILDPLMRAAGVEDTRSLPKNIRSLTVRLHEMETQESVRVLLVVNEAHLLHPECLHALRSYWEWRYMGEPGPFFSTLFIAQLCFSAALQRVREVRRRVPPPVVLPRLSGEEARRILRDRLAGAGGDGLLTDGALRVCIQAGQGIALDAIRFAGLAAVQAYLDGEAKVKQSHAERAVVAEGGPVSVADAVRDSGFTRWAILEYAKKRNHESRLNKTSLSQLENSRYQSKGKDQLTAEVLSVIDWLKELSAGGELPEKAYASADPRKRPDASPSAGSGQVPGKMAAAS